MPESPTANSHDPRPTKKQLRYLKILAEQRGQSFIYPTTVAKASSEIDRLRNVARTPKREVAQERREIADDLATTRRDGVRVRGDEVHGHNSPARWSTAEDDR